MKKVLNLKMLLIIMLAAFISACDLNNNDEPQITDDYLVSSEIHTSYGLSQMKAMLTVYSNFYPELQSIADNLQHDIDVYKITYKTTFDGQEIIASGLVSVPKTNGIYPILSYQNGTNTLHSDAPSMDPDNQLFQLLEFLASSGFVVSVPDYLGFGASSNMFHPYLDKESTIQTVTDMLKAVEELVANHLEIEVSKDLYITGYSQGGWATMQLQKSIEENNTGEFNLKASSCGAGPYDLRYVNDYVLGLTNYPMPYFIGYVFNGHLKLGDITNPAGDIFKSPYDQKILNLYDGTKSGDEINAQLTTSTADLFTAEYKTTSNTNPKFSSVISSLNNNSIAAWKTNIPTLITHGTADTYVPEQISINMYDDFLEKGVDQSKITYIAIPGAGHNTAVIPSGVATFNWFISLNNAQY
ncbi:MAG: alpha/beta fold hydrolase [Draconibacterium sp.]|nr:alpha/beta fold hydrolase [Draconibacterium sp.]